MKPESLKTLALALKTKRKNSGMSLRDVRDTIGVSNSTLSRIEHEIGSPDADVLGRLADWLGIPLDSLLNDAQEESAVVAYLDRSMPEIVRRHLSRDKNLTPENAERLAEIFRVSYEQFTDYSKGNWK